MKILIVEDDFSIAESLRKNFFSENINVSLSKDGVGIPELICKTNFDVIILDWRLPNESGFEICRKIRSSGSVIPIIILTALNNTKNKVAALDVGADDYITKPFEFEELLARIKAISRRSNHSFHIVEFYGYRLNIVTHELHFNGTTIKLSEKEFEVLNYMFENKGKIISKDELGKNIWKISFSPGTNIIEATIKNLRKKLDEHSQNKIIKTVYGEGYLFVED